MTNATVCATLRLSVDAIQGSSDRVRSLIELLALGRDVPRVDLDGALDELLGAGRRLRDALADGSRRIGASEEQPAWTTASEMRTIIERVAGRLELAGRLETLVQELGTARIVERVDARRRRLESLRSAARAALAGADPALVGTLVWPPDQRDSWTRWVLSLEDPEATRALDAMSASVPALGELLTALTAAQWDYAAVSAPRGAEAAGEAITPIPTYPSAPASEPVPTPPPAAFEAAPAPWQDPPQPAMAESSVWAPAERGGGEAVGQQADGPTGAALPIDAMLGTTGQDHAGSGATSEPDASLGERAAESWVAQWRRNRMSW